MEKIVAFLRAVAHTHAALIDLFILILISETVGKELKVTLNGAEDNYFCLYIDFFFLFINNSKG